MHIAFVYSGPTPSDLGKGSFGSVAPYTCRDCGARVWSEPELVCISRPTRWEPGEYAYRCPRCGVAAVTETERHERVTVARRRYVINLRAAA